MEITLHTDTIPHLILFDSIVVKKKNEKKTISFLTTLRLIMGQSKEPPQQHKQPSRKGKKAWRKNVDVTGLQAGLEEARKEVIKGLVPPMLKSI